MQLYDINPFIARLFVLMHRKCVPQANFFKIDWIWTNISQGCNTKSNFWEHKASVTGLRSASDCSFWTWVINIRLRLFLQCSYFDIGHKSQPQIVLRMFLFLGKSQPQCSYKIVLIKKRVYILIWHYAFDPIEEYNYNA